MKTFEFTSIRNSFIEAMKKPCNVQPVNVYQNVYIDLQSFSSTFESYDFVISNGLGNGDRVLYRKFMYLKRNENSFEVIRKELSKQLEHRYQVQQIMDWSNRFIMWSDNSLSFDYLLKKACEKFLDIPFITVLTGVVNEFKNMQTVYPELFFIKE